LRCFRRRHQKLSLRKPQSLDQNRARNLSPHIVASFYNNLEAMYKIHNYEAQQIWNCDEIGAQAGRDGGAYVLARKGSKSVLKVIPNQREWLSVVSCINAQGIHISNYYIF